MADLTTTTPLRLFVDGRAPFADEGITFSAAGLLSLGTPEANGDVWITGLADGTCTITVTPGTEDVNRSAGTLDVTVTTPAPPEPLVVTLG